LATDIQTIQRIFTDLDLSIFDMSSTSFTDYNSVVTFFYNKLVNQLPSYYDYIKVTGSNIESLLYSYAKVLAYIYVTTASSRFSIINVPPVYLNEDFAKLLDFSNKFPNAWTFKQIYSFLTALLYVYLHGSTTESIKYGLQICLERKPDIWEFSKLIGKPGFSIYDISYIHQFDVYIYATESPYFWGSYLLASELLKKVKPAHTLFNTAVVFEEEFGYNLGLCYNYLDGLEGVSDTGEWTYDCTFSSVPSILDCDFVYVDAAFCEERSPCTCTLGTYDIPCDSSTDCCPSWRGSCCSPEWTIEEEFIPVIELTDAYLYYEPCGPFVYDPASICVPPYDTAPHCGRPFDYMVSAYDKCFVYDEFACLVDFIEEPVV